MSKQDRLNRILELIIERGSVEVQEAAHILDVSPATIRRDFDALSARQLLNRTHGGASATGGSFNLPLTYKVAKDDEIKKRIAALAATMVKRYQVVGINGGTTATEVARALAASAEFSPGGDTERPPLTVVTNALNIATELTVRNQIRIVVTGGVARAQSYELTGPFAESVLEEVIIDVAFLGVEGLHPDTGAAAAYEDEARVNHMIASRAKKVVVVADSSKFDKRSFAAIKPFSEIDVIITDAGIDPKVKKSLEEQGVEIVIA